MPVHKHLTSENRCFIERSLNDQISFKGIARDLSRDPTTISKEVRNHIIFKKTGAYARPYNACIHRVGCQQSNLCRSINCKNKKCTFCSHCNNFCPQFEEQICLKLAKPPYVCNACEDLRKCTLQKSFYRASYAQKEYEAVLHESRQGVAIDEKEIIRLDKIISPLLKQGQSIHHICCNNADTIMYDERTIYNYVDYGIFSARNIDLPRKVRFKPRKKAKQHFKIDKACRIGRSYNDFLDYMTTHPDTPIVEMDTVEGVKGGKVLLTIHFTQTQFMLAFLRNSNTSQSVIDVFNYLYTLLGGTNFRKLFPVILTDNGSEFSNPTAIEFDTDGSRRTTIFYCNPSAPYQKGAAENNHEFIRKIIPKGNSFNNFSQNDITRMMNHVNSYGRKKLNDRSPNQSFGFFYGMHILERLGANLIHPNEIILNPSLLK